MSEEDPNTKARRAAAEHYFKPSGVDGVMVGWIETGVDDFGEIAPSVKDLAALLVAHADSAMAKANARYICLRSDWLRILALLGIESQFGKEVFSSVEANLAERRILEIAAEVRRDERTKAEREIVTWLRRHFDNDLPLDIADNIESAAYRTSPVSALDGTEMECCNGTRGCGGRGEKHWCAQ